MTLIGRLLLALLLIGPAWSLVPAQAQVQVPAQAQPQPDPSVVPAAPRSPGDGTLRVATFDVPPLMFRDDGGRMRGYATEVLERVGAQSGLRWQLVSRPTLADALDAVRRGDADLIAPLGVTAAREGWLLFTRPIADLSVAILAGPRSPPGVAGAGSLSGRRVAVLADSFIAEQLSGVAPRVAIVPQPTDRDVLARLAVGEVDYAVVELSRAAWHIDRLGLANLRVAGDLPLRYRPSIGVPRDNPGLHATLDAAMRQLSAGDLRAIQSRWLTPLEVPWWKRPVGLALLAALVASVLLLWRLRARTLRGDAELEQARHMLDRTSRASNVGSWELHLDPPRVHWSAQTHAIHGTDPAAGTPGVDEALAFFLPEGRLRLREAVTRCAEDGQAFALDAQIRTVSGELRWVRVTGEGERERRTRRGEGAGTGRVVRVRGTFQDIETQTRQRMALAHSERLYRTLADNVTDLITLQDERGTLLYASPSARRIAGRDPDALVGRSALELAHPDDVPSLIAAQQATLAGEAMPVIWRLMREDGSCLWMESRAQRLTGPQGEPEIVMTSRDITERRNAEARMHFMAHHDELTRLPNRIALVERIERHIGTDPSGPLALLFLDIDNFKNVNDTQGHERGDELLKALAARLGEQLPPPIFLARLSGDEFVALIAGRDALEAAQRHAQGVMRLFDLPFEVGSVERVFLSASAGVALYPRDASDADALLAAADTALLAAKQAGRNTWRVFEPALRAAMNEKARALQGVRTAFERGEFELWFQPKVCLPDRQVCGFEALLRRRTREGVAGPGNLIEAAEDSGFITTLGTWIVETAARQSRAWRKEGVDVPIAVNISFKQLQDPEFLTRMKKLLEEDPELPRYLEIELTETAIALDAQQATHRLLELRRLGFRMHIDDFGTGYSSLSYVSQLPVDTLKIDRSFVKDLPDDPGSREVIRAVTALASSLGLRVVAEGTETEEQAAFLQANGCDEAQGHLFARAMAADDAARFAHEDVESHGPMPGRGEGNTLPVPARRPDGTPVH